MDRKILWVELLGITMSGIDKPDAGLVWSNLEGWWGLPDARGQGDTIPGGHGRFQRTTIHREARVITLTGHIYASTNRELHATRDRLEAALAAGTGAMRVATESSGIWERGVEVDTLTIDPDRGKRWTRFVVDIVAPDPRRYGPLMRVGPVSLPVAQGGVRLPRRMPWNFGSVSAGGRLIIPNSGAIPTNPTIIIEGGFEAVSITDVTAGRRLRLEWPITDDNSVVFDSRTRRVEIGNVEITRWLIRREWFEIPAGATHEFRFEVTAGVGSPRMWGEYREGAW